MMDSTVQGHHGSGLGCQHGGHGTASAPDLGGAHLVFYDGQCGLCDRFVRFVLDRDRAALFRFTPLQGALAARELASRGVNPEALDTVYVLTTDGDLLRKSRAVLFVLRELGGAWGLVSLLRCGPVGLADRLYDVVAAVRDRVFGRFDSCRVPTASERSRFIDVNAPPGPPSE